MDTESAMSSQGPQRRRSRIGGRAGLPDQLRREETERPTIEISFPAETPWLEILRSVIGRASRMAGFSYDGIEDFAMAVDEAATILIDTRPSDLVLTVLTGLGPRLEVLVSANDPAKSLYLADLRADYRWELLQALCEEVWWEDIGTSIGLAQSTR